MKNDHNASFSDLETARSLTRRLSEPTAASPASPATEPPPYVRFRAPAVRSRESSAVQETYGSSGWHRFLDECLHEASADAAFVMDRDGLLVAVRGAASTSSLEPLAASLMGMFSQAMRMHPDGTPPRAVAIELEPGWLTAIAVESEEPITLGIISPQPTHSSLMSRVRHALPAAPG